MNASIPNAAELELVVDALKASEVVAAGLGLFYIARPAWRIHRLRLGDTSHL